MIPKIIHLCWLSGDSFPAEIINCLNTWREHLQGYEIWLWGKTPADIKCLNGQTVIEKHFDINSIPWTQQAYNERKYAFAADYIRLYALYHHGGIYLDADVVVYRNFDLLLHLPYFIGCDQIKAFEAAVIGAEKGSVWIKEILETYADKSFIKDNGEFDMMELPVRLHHELIRLGYRFKKISHIEDFTAANTGNKVLVIFDKDYFNSRNAVEVKQTKKSICAHNYAGSWQTKNKRKSLKSFLPKRILALIYVIGQHSWARNKYSWFQIPFEK